jgi:hypothetical protein
MACSFVMLPVVRAEMHPAIIITATITATNFFIFFASSALRLVFCPALCERFHKGIRTSFRRWQCFVKFSLKKHL